MKNLRTILLFPAVIFTVFVAAQSSDKNYVQTITPQVQVLNESQLNNLQVIEKFESINYMDGLGRTIQSVNVKMSPNLKDVISIKEYDEVGRMLKSYMPFTRYNWNGSFVNDAINKQASFYWGALNVPHSSRPYQEHVYENSPLQRIDEIAPPGSANELGSDHTIKTTRLFNTNIQIPIIRYENENLSYNGNYGANNLFIEEVKDENGHVSKSYQDQFGRVIMTSDGNNQEAKTYYVYDEIDNLRVVIPPLAFFQFSDAGNDFSAINEELLFSYQFDQRKRMITKKVPSRGIEFMVYDKLDQLVLHQTAAQRESDKWTYYKYDGLGRTILSGIFIAALADPGGSPPTSRSGLQFLVDQQTSLFEKRYSGAGHRLFYTNNAFPQTGLESRVVYYFDDYDFDYNGTDDYNYVSQTYDPFTIGQGDSDSPGIMTNNSTVNTRGLQTMSKVKVIDGSSNQLWITTVSFYDDHNRLIQSQYNDHNSQNIISEDNFFYNFAGQLRCTDQYHRKLSSDNIRIQTRTDYDHGGRVIRESMKVENNDPVVISEMKYNENNQLIEKNIHSKQNAEFLQSVDYRYNIRGWLKNINNCDLSNDQIYFPNPGSDSSKELEAAIVKNLQVDVSLIPTLFNDPMNVILLKGNYLHFIDNNSNKEVIVDGEQANTGSAIRETKYYQQVVQYLLMTSSEKQQYLAAMSIIQRRNFDDALRIEMGRPELQALNDLDGEAYLLSVNELDISEDISTVSAINSVGEQLTSQLVNLGYYDELVVDLIKIVVAKYMVNVVGSVYVNNDDNDLWGTCIMYDQISDNLDNAPQFNGNISEIHWKSLTDEVKRGYGYNYDGLNRLINADFAAQNSSTQNWDSEVGNYDVSRIGYDLNGNIDRLVRRGRIVSPNDNFNIIDNLSYGYIGNTLKSISDVATSSGYGNNDFVDVASIIDYMYDTNGNMIQDYNKGMTLEYNQLDRITNVYFDGGEEITYLYDALGNKLKKTTDDGNNISTTDYVGSFQYNNGDLDFISTSEGRIMPENNNTFRYEYHIKDQLGSMRVAFSDLDGDDVLDPTTEVLQVESYYPYGMKHEGLSTPQIGPENQYNYTGKEDQLDFDFNMIDYGARMYDASIGRWHSIDPLASDYFSSNPYNYVLCNPINLIDPDGMYAWEPIGNGQWRAQAGDGAWSLSQDAGISFDEAKQILANTTKDNSLGNMGTYTDPDDGIEKSAVDEGDVVAINPEQTKVILNHLKVLKEVKEHEEESLNAYTNATDNLVLQLEGQVNSNQVKIDEAQRDINIVYKTTLSPNQILSKSDGSYAAYVAESINQADRVYRLYELVKQNESIDKRILGLKYYKSKRIVD